MRLVRLISLVICTVCLLLLLQDCADSTLEIVRPEKIQSKRIVVYDKDTYNELAMSWKIYYSQFPSEDAYANWMYAARYAGWDDYTELLEDGLEKYPANPVLLYLAGCKKQGASNDDRSRMYLERAVILDPSYTEPWFSLVIQHMSRGDLEQMDVALRRLLEAAAISNEVMDYSYNLLSGLDKNAILVTNGDNDTYPGWILTRLLEHRSDVMLVNRSLLNTDWYPQHLIKEGAPRFITGGELEILRKDTKPPYSEPLIERLVETSIVEGRPVYFSHTLYRTEVVNRYCENGLVLGLATLVTPPAEQYRVALGRVVKIWLEDFRTAGLDSWTLLFSKNTHAGRMLMLNYPASLKLMMEDISRYTPEYRAELFYWYQYHSAKLISDGFCDDMNEMWCALEDVDEIQAWCRRQGYK